VYLENVGQRKIIECSGVKPVLKFTVSADDGVTLYLVRGE
jgi:hypothetical protein